MAVPLLAPPVLINLATLVQRVIPKSATFLITILTKQPKNVPIFAKIVLTMVLAFARIVVPLSAAGLVRIFAAAFVVVPGVAPPVRLVEHAFLGGHVVDGAAWLVGV